MGGPPVSWFLVERGWVVVDAAGEKVGVVEEVLGDEPSGIFHGLVVNGEEVVADRIEQIREGQVQLIA